MPTFAYPTQKGKIKGAMGTGPFTPGSAGNIYQESYEDAFFTYRIFTWFHEVAGTSGTDGWRKFKRNLS